MLTLQLGSVEEEQPSSSAALLCIGSKGAPLL